jgi:hypothetical protein
MKVRMGGHFNTSLHGGIQGFNRRGDGLSPVSILRESSWTENTTVRADTYTEEEEE